MFLLLAILGCSPCQETVRAEPHTPLLCDDIYDPDRVFQVAIEIDPAEWDGLRDEFVNWEARKDQGLDLKPYHPLRSFEANGRVIEDAQIRLKGNPCCSWSGEKMQFVISFNEEDEDGRFRGLRKIALDAPPYDPSVLRERVALSYFEDAGFATSCSNSAALTINGAYYGLYTNIEYVDREFLERQFPDEEEFGNLYKWAYNEGRFVRRNHREDGSNADIRAFREIEDMETFEALLDTDQSIDFWAAEAVINQSDGYWAGSINFYLYNHPEKGWQFFPWDLDHAITWWSPYRSPFRRKDYHGAAPLVDLLFSTPQGRVRFAAAVDDMHRHHDIDALLTRVDQWAEQIRPWVAREPHRAFSMNEFDAEVARIRDDLARRHMYLCQRDIEDDDPAASP